MIGADQVAIIWLHYHDDGAYAGIEVDVNGVVDRYATGDVVTDWSAALHALPARVTLLVTSGADSFVAASAGAYAWGSDGKGRPMIVRKGTMTNDRPVAD